MNIAIFSVLRFAFLTALAVVLFRPVFLLAQDDPKEKQERREQQEPAREVTPVPIVNHVAEISADNTLVEFVGTHVGDRPDPRLGGFREFAGKIQFNEDDSAITAIQVEFKIDSLWTEFDDLTGHLKNPDFFEAEKFPTATFTSTSIEMGENGFEKVRGNLTLHGVTKEIGFETKSQITDAGVILVGGLTLDRTHFGMDKMTTGVEPAVTIEVHVGTPTVPRPSAPPRERAKKKTNKKENPEAPLPETVSIELFLPNMV